MPKQAKHQVRKAKMPTMSGNAFFRPESIDRENRTVEIVMSTGEAGKRYDWYNDTTYLEELRLTKDTVRTARLDKGIPLISDHSRSVGIRGVLGTSEAYRFENNELIGTVRFSKRDDVEDIFNDVADGILRNVSLGYKVHKYERFRATEDEELDRYVAVDLEPLEISLVQVPFESTNGVRSERNDTQLNEVEIIEDRKMAKELPTKTVQITEQPEVKEERAVETNVAPDTISNANKVESRADLVPMLEAARQAGLESSLATEAFTRGISVDEFRVEVLQTLSDQSQEKNIVTQNNPSLKSDNRSDSHETMRSDVEIHLTNRADPSAADLTEGARQFNGMNLMEVARQVLESQGINTRGLSKMALAERALHTTSDFPSMLANVMNKGMRGAYAEVPRTFMEFGRRSTVSDFRPVHRMALGDAPDLKKLNEHGEFTRGSMGEETESYKIATYGRIFGITRNTLINDDLNAFTRLSSMWAASSARLQNRLFWGMILGYDFDKGVAAPYLMADGNNVFGAKNSITGASSAFSDTAFSTMRKMGRKQKSIDNKNMNISYNKLALPAELETTAEQLLLQTIVPATVATSNPFKGKFEFVIEPLLDEISATAWYAFASTNQIDTFEYAFLQGEEELNIETRTGFDVDGFEVRARTDVGGGWVDRRGAFKSAGA